MSEKEMNDANREAIKEIVREVLMDEGLLPDIDAIKNKTKAARR